MTIDDDEQLWAMHPRISDADVAESAAAYQAHHQVELPEPDFDHCRDCGADLDVEDEPFLYCLRCLPEAMRRDPWPWPLPEECP